MPIWQGKAQTTAETLQPQTVEVDYTLPLGTKTIADIKVTGTENYEEYVLIGFSGLSVGQEIKIQGRNYRCRKTLLKQGYFSDVKILATKVTNDSVWLENST